MDLWIRSQNRKRLFKCNRLHIELENDGSFYIWDVNDILGKYETEERALQILNEIQRVIISENISGFVYYMPEE